MTDGMPTEKISDNWSQVTRGAGLNASVQYLHEFADEPHPAPSVFSLYIRARTLNLVQWKTTFLAFVTNSKRAF